jgi:type II secretory pathway component PulK
MMESIRSKKSSLNSQGGFALLIVTLSITIMAIIIHIFVFRTKKELKAATTEAEKVKAKYIAYSTLEITKLFLKVQSKFLDNNAMLSNMGIDMGQMMPMIMPMFFGQGNLLTMMIGQDIEGMGLKESQGTGGLDMFKSEDGKINLNCAIGASNLAGLTTMLTALFYDRRYDELFQRNTSNIHTLDREQQVFAIIDYIDIDQSGLGPNGGSEDGYYNGLKDPFDSKNNILDSVGNIRFIQGIDDIFWVNFGQSFTVYGGCKINLCAVDPENWILIAGIIAGSAKNNMDQVLTDPMKLKILASTIAPQIQGICKDTDTFVQAVANPGIAGGLIAGALGVSVDSMGDLGDDGISDAEVQGIELDPAKLQTMVTNGPKRFYRIKGYGLVGKTKHQVEIVWDQLAINQSTGTTGGYVYWHEE